LNNPELAAELNDQFATEAEIRSAMEIEAKNPSPRITAAAKWILSRHTVFRLQTTEFDLIYSAYEAILDVRSWNKAKVDFPNYVVGVMRSLASNATRKLSKTSPQVIYGQDERDDDDSMSITTSENVLTPEEIMIQTENETNGNKRIKKLRSQLNDDSIELKILNMLLDQGLSKGEIRIILGLSSKEFWAADRRLQRAIENLGGNE